MCFYSMFQGLRDSLSLCVTAACAMWMCQWYADPSSKLFPMRLTNPAKSATVTSQTISLQGNCTHIVLNCTWNILCVTNAIHAHLPGPCGYGGSSKLPCLGLHILLVIPRVEGITLQQWCCLRHGILPPRPDMTSRSSFKSSPRMAFYTNWIDKFEEILMTNLETSPISLFKGLHKGRFNKETIHFFGAAGKGLILRLLRIGKPFRWENTVRHLGLIDSKQAPTDPRNRQTNWQHEETSSFRCPHIIGKGSWDTCWYGWDQVRMK